MRVIFPTLMLSLVLLSGCGSGSWFGGDAPDASVLEPIEQTNPLIPERSIFRSDDGPPPYPGTPIDAISDLAVERIPGGVVIRATGQTGASGAFNAQLTPANAEEAPVDGVLTYRLEAQYTPRPAGARIVTVARELRDQDLAGVRTVRVEGVQNALERRR